MDPSIPRHRNSTHVTSGWFVRRRDPERSIILRDRRNNQWPLDQVSICAGLFGYDDEGFSKLPRPAEYDDTGRETIRGDRCAILFLNGSRKAPVVLPGFRSIKTSLSRDFLSYSHRKPDSADWNKLSMRVQPRTDEGVPLGSIDIEAGAGGQVLLHLSTGPPDGDGPRMGIEIDYSAQQITLTDITGAQVRLTGGKIDLVDGISTFLYPVAVAGDAAAGFYKDLAAALLALGDTTGMAAKLTAELAAPGTNLGYASNLVRST